VALNNGKFRPQKWCSVI